MSAADMCLLLYLMEPGCKKTDLKTLSRNHDLLIQDLIYEQTSSSLLEADADTA